MQPIKLLPDGWKLHHALVLGLVASIGARLVDPVLTVAGNLLQMAIRAAQQGGG